MQNSLKHHHEMYQKAKERIDKEHKNIDEIANIRAEYQMNKIEMVKYNYMMDDAVQNFACNDGYLQLTDGGRYLQIMTNKAHQHVDTKKIEYKMSQSSGSCYLSEIKGFIYGANVSRFWVLRKHIISLRNAEIGQGLPFYAWQCITLLLRNREISLVIKNEKDMANLIKLLCSELNTIDGSRNSAIGVKKALLKQKIQDYEKQLKKKQTEEWRLKLFEHEVSHEVMRKVSLKYSLIKMRSKLSFECFKRRLTFTEHLLKAMLASYVSLIDRGEIPPQHTSTEIVDLFNCVMSNDSGSNLKRFIQIF